jgi:site-specific DNA-methyltransferase (adenine-specific)
MPHGAGDERGVVRRGFHGRDYERLRGDLRTYDDRFDDYWGFLEPRLEEAWRLLADDGTLYLHLDYREAHYAKVLLDALFGRDRFLNELIWAYDYGAKTKRRWPTEARHDPGVRERPGTVLVRFGCRRPRALHGPGSRHA